MLTIKPCYNIIIITLKKLYMWDTTFQKWPYFIKKNTSGLGGAPALSEATVSPRSPGKSPTIWPQILPQNSPSKTGSKGKCLNGMGSVCFLLQYIIVPSWIYFWKDSQTPKPCLGWKLVYSWWALEVHFRTNVQHIRDRQMHKYKWRRKRTR